MFASGYHGCRKCLKDPRYSETVTVFFHHTLATVSYVYIMYTWLSLKLKV